MFRRILVANRGEIAARILRACEALGIESVVVHSDADRGAPWLGSATKTVCLGPGRPSDSYLNASAVLQAAEQTECQALHPGYGFLAESGVFAARCEQQGLTFIGPGAAAIRKMGDKASAKRTMADHGLDTIPGSAGILDDVAEARGIADDVGYPVFLKATAGGGGKGMRRCDRPDQLDTAFAEASLEARNAFGDPSLYLEKLIEGGRHIEFQVLCDAYGNAIHLRERDCSIQRNNQKLIEESPSPGLADDDRSRVGDHVARALASSGYVNAGTVEFLQEPGGALYFMEVNARLQVEHPVTEMITGVDLVEQQIRVAANEPLAITQDELRFQGHAIEFRINAEDVDAGFRPDPGVISRFIAPNGSAGVRWDSAVREGYRIPPWYDSMIGKLIVHAATRDAALERGASALDSLVIEGVRTTVALHRRILDDDAFRAGRYDLNRLTEILG
ncbi:MAG: acetyl-CoA carboxylase biotin carboxylase subunit [Acidobacteria bacterium]|nr:acetyl-CoA carboxylase biotin carboxylase subunit [Acidobacteriota bacterium]NIM62123.1 acetyl-CoA carboxylase biotin carboxylase subunit [Acidobacteriota bacterium]NIO59777.1 acetyl-CoA carboxylase biotin carboxylase subunit [Acidobacteriota bacterium]NIQ30860.1 acetyl-CoA carboxylase biotin carboxylase subunit [Acidobacteriota bacterium]NIQ85933.1 acetyl-CoA carboxylase biotin carboxylase subunit [Acidobacteriota bacterium]